MLLRCLVIIGALSCDIALAGVYRCLDKNGVVEFRDRGCEIASASDDFLPYVYKLTDLDVVLEKESALPDTQKIRQKQELEAQKKIKLEVRQKKTIEKAAAKTERRLMHCERTCEKIKAIEAELRGGCKPRRMKTLKKQLIHAQQMQKRYCSHPKGK